MTNFIIIKLREKMRLPAFNIKREPAEQTAENSDKNKINFKNNRKVLT